MQLNFEDIQLGDNDWQRSQQKTFKGTIDKNIKRENGKKMFMNLTIKLPRTAFL